MHLKVQYRIDTIYIYSTYNFLPKKNRLSRALTGVLQVVGSRPDVFSYELKIITSKS